MDLGKLHGIIVNLTQQHCTVPKVKRSPERATRTQLAVEVFYIREFESIMELGEALDRG